MQAKCSIRPPEAFWQNTIDLQCEICRQSQCKALSGLKKSGRRKNNGEQCKKTMRSAIEAMRTRARPLAATKTRREQRRAAGAQIQD
jgi:hypothetical protein